MVQLQRVRDTVELGIVAGVGTSKAPRTSYTCGECKAPTPTMHLVPVLESPRVLKLCVACYNRLVDLVSPCKAVDWVPRDVLLRGESIAGYLARRLRAWRSRKASGGGT